MILAELYVKVQGYMIGRFCSGFNIIVKQLDSDTYYANLLRIENTFEKKITKYEPPYFSHSHEIFAQDPVYKKEIFWTYGYTKTCKDSGLYYIQAHFGSTPIVFESTNRKSVICRIGYRTDYKFPRLTYRNTPKPDPCIIWRPE
jgi:hypothetical protein